ncbi:MAG: metalloregulator ArsR/SmtB family transcription factor [Candidatus Eisenbacteria bacterium]
MDPNQPISIPLDRRAKDSEAQNEELAKLAKALAHPARAAIVRLLLSGGECVCGGIVDRIPLAQATVSQHLKVLKEAGWIKGEVDGPRVCYCARPETLTRFVELARGLEPTMERSPS